MRPPLSRLTLARSMMGAVLASCYVAAVVPGPAGAAAAPRAVPPRAIDYVQWDSGAELRTGVGDGVRVERGRLQLAAPSGTRTLGGTRYEHATWRSTWVSPGFDATEVIASWSAITPGDSYVEIHLRGRDASERLSSWDLLGRWASTDRYLRRATESGQADDLASVNVDTWQASGGLRSWQVRVTLARRAGSTTRPSLDAVGAVASRLPSTTPPTSRPGPGRGIVLDVPRYSQMIHRGHYPQWGSGGQAWCSPTSTSMVLGYYRKLPAPASYAWVDEGHPDPWVDYAARMTFDHAYDGTGNWPFNTAYAAPRVGKAFVTRLRSLREAERFVAAGIPLVASISFGSGDLDGTPISATNGHLLVIVGFAESGDVVVNDPAASTRRGVRRTYDRAQFERAWLPRSGGLVYVIRDAAHPLPSDSPGNW